MKQLLLLALAIHSFWVSAQCPFTVSLTGTGNNCLGTTLTVNSGSPLTQIVWYNGPTAVSTAQSYQVSIVAAGNGSGTAADQLNFPGGVMIDGNQNVYVSDVGNNRVQMWAPGATTGVTVAGGNGAGPAANQLTFPRGVFVDVSGNLYICDNNNARVQEWAPGATSGVTVAGGNGIGAAANQLNSPMGICVDASGNIYVADQYNNRVQEWTPGANTGITVAGGNGAGSAANQLNEAIGVWVDAVGNVYVADQNNDRIQLWRNGQTSGNTVAGGNGAGSAANQLNDPNNVMVDASGNVYVADYLNNRIQKWRPGDLAGTTVAGGNGFGPALDQTAMPNDMFVDPHGDVFVTDTYNNRVEEWSYDATINNQYTPTVAGFYTAVVTNSSGCTQTTNAVVVGSTITPSVTIATASATVNSCTTVTFTATGANTGATPTYQWQVNGVNVGTNNPTYASSQLNNNDNIYCILTNNNTCSANPKAVSNSIQMTVTGPPSVTVLSKGALCAGDTLMVSSSDSLSQIAWYSGSTLLTTVMATSPVNGGITVAGGHGQGQGANQLNVPEGMFVDGSGNIYVGDTYNNRVQKWMPGAPSGVTVAGTGSIYGTSNPNGLDQPIGVWVDGSGNVYVSDGGNSRVQKWAPGATTGVTVAGFDGQGNAANQLDGPFSLFMDAGGNLYIADVGNSRVQKWAPGALSGTTVAGGGGGTPLNFPDGLFVDGAGNLYVTELTDNTVLKFAPGSLTGTIVAGGNGSGSAANQLTNPIAVYVDAAGNVYVADAINERIQKWAPGATTGVTVAGGNGSGNAANQLDYPAAIYVDANGNIYVCDTYNQRIQEWPQHSSIDITYKNAAPGTYTATVTTSGGCSITSNTLVVLPKTTPSVSVNPSATALCAANTFSFTATPVNGGTAPSYQWQVNGKNVGTDQDSWSSDTLTNGASVSCILTSNASCTVPASDTSAAIALTVTPILSPSVSITASATTVCTGSKVSFTATASNTGPNPDYQWMLNGMPVGSDIPDYADDHFSNGDIITCLVSSHALCVTNATALSNGITLTVMTIITPVVSIAESAGTDCAGTPITFTATATNAGNDPGWQWQVNGVDQGSGNPVFTSSSLANGDIVSCTLTNGAVCAPAASNSLTVTIPPVPAITPGQIFQLSAGQGVTLDPAITGDIASYAWSPAAGLSDSTIRDPVADPVKTTVYTLRVVSPDGCDASAEITVKVFIKLAIPGAFTPNGDGKNDVFYVLGSPPGTEIGDLSVYNRYGEKIFQVHDVPTGDPAFGWDGRFKGTPAPTGTYVYILTLNVSNGPPQIFKGTVILVR